MSLICQGFVFCWPGKVKSVCDIVSSMVIPVTVINSAENSKCDNWINIGTDSYFGNQFRKCLEMHKSGNVLLHIQGDTEYHNWDRLTHDALKYIKKYNAGVYYPQVTNTSWTPDKMSVVAQSSEDTNIKYIACGDETVWFIHPAVISKCRELKLFDLFDGLMFGFGWDLIICAVSHMLSMPVIRDYDHVIQHEKGTNYKFHDAFCELKILLKSLPDEISSIVESMQNNHKETMKLNL